MNQGTESITRKQDPEFEQKMIEAHETILGQVWSILQRHPKARSNDLFLVTVWLMEVHRIKTWNAMLSLADENGANLESVRRARQQIQARGYFTPDPETSAGRRRAGKVLANTINHMDPLQVIEK
jgi:hypothetical protein